MGVLLVIGWAGALLTDEGPDNGGGGKGSPQAAPDQLLLPEARVAKEFQRWANNYAEQIVQVDAVKCDPLEILGEPVDECYIDAEHVDFYLDDVGVAVEPDKTGDGLQIDWTGTVICRTRSSRSRTARSPSSLAADRAAQSYDVRVGSLGTRSSASTRWAGATLGSP